MALKHKLVNGKQVPCSQEDLDQIAIDEAKHLEYLDYINSYTYKRLEAYQKETDPLFKEAISEFLCEGNRAKLDQLAAIRLRIKQDYPKSE